MMRKLPIQFRKYAFSVGCLFFCLPGAYAFSPDSAKVYKGRVVDNNDLPIFKAEIRNYNDRKIITSDSSGIFSLLAHKGDKIEVKLNDNLVATKILGVDSLVKVVLDEKNVSLLFHRQIRLPFGISAPRNLSATSTDAVYSTDLKKIPTTSVNAAIVGRLAGLYSFQNSGRPGNDAPTLLLRGREPVYIIDGVPRTLTTFNLDEIESVTVLKDALSTAMLGVRGYNGAVLITTKKGVAASQSVSMTVQSGFQQSLKQPKALNAYDYATLYNEARVNDGLTPVYSAADLEAYRTGSDPYGHPDVDWQREILKNSTRFDQYNLNVSGGNNFGKYFVSFQHVNQTGFFKTSDVNKYDTNDKFLSYVIRSNVDLNINKKLSAGIYLLGRILNSNGPGFSFDTFSSTDAILYRLYSTPNNAYPVFNPDGSYGTSPTYTTNLYGQTVNSGYFANYKRDIIADLYLKRTLDEITKGLWIRVSGSLNSRISENINRFKSFAAYSYSATANTYTQFGTNGTQSNVNSVDFQTRTDYEEVKLGYDRRVGRSGISALLMANRDNFVTGSNLPYTIQGISGHATYDWDKKYVAEFAFGYNGSNYYPPSGDFKYGFFPAAGLSWNLSNESFMENVKGISNLRIYSSYGKTGNDNPGYFSYIQRYFDGTSVYFGSTPGSNTSIFEQPLANPNITFEQANKFNAGLEGSFFNSKLGLKFEYYNNKYYDLLMVRGRNNALLGQSYPQENIGKQRYTGIEANLNWQQSFKNGSGFFVGLNASTQQSEVLFSDEVARNYDWMRRTGQKVNQMFGYIADGLIRTNDDLAKAAVVEGYTPQLGDIKYKDLNGDGIINQFDETAIGSTKPLIFYGLNIGGHWKNFDLGVLLQGVSNRKIYLSGMTEWAFQTNGTGQAWEQNLDRWTPATASTATYPRVNIGTNINNQASSTFWVRSGNYVRLKNVELGYTLPKNLSARVGLNATRIFLSGTNLLTFAAFDRVDPEVYNGSYPIQEVLNIGVNVKF